MLLRTIAVCVLEDRSLLLIVDCIPRRSPEVCVYLSVAFEMLSSL